MSSPSLHSQTGFLRPAIDWRGWRMMTRGPLRGLSICVTTRRLDVSCRETAPGHLITHFSARSVVTGSYGKIVSTCDRHTTTCTDTGPPYGRTASVLVVPACKHPPGTNYIPERIPLPEDVSIILSVLSIRRSALSGANFTWLFSSFCCLS
jgi:hypothetical protein